LAGLIAIAANATAVMVALATQTMAAGDGRALYSQRRTRAQ